MYLSSRAINSSVESSGPERSLRPRKSTICLVLWPKVNLSPRDSTGTDRAPIFCSSARPFGSSRTFTETKSIPRTDRNSLSLRQLVQPGCQNTLNGSISYPCTQRRCYASRRLVANDADLVAVRIANIGAVVVRMIVRAQTGLAFVRAAVGHRRCMSRVDCRPSVGFEADGEAVAGRRRLP